MNENIENFKNVDATFLLSTIDLKKFNYLKLPLPNHILATYTY